MNGREYLVNFRDAGMSRPCYTRRRRPFRARGRSYP
jgi:hypothetical protein